jgi:hypothetical protein
MFWPGDATEVPKSPVERSAVVTFTGKADHDDFEHGAHALDEPDEAKGIVGVM